MKETKAVVIETHRGQQTNSLVELSVRTHKVTWKLRQKTLEEASHAEMGELPGQRELQGQRSERLGITRD